MFYQLKTREKIIFDFAVLFRSEEASYFCYFMGGKSERISHCVPSIQDYEHKHFRLLAALNIDSSYQTDGQMLNLFPPILFTFTFKKG